MDFNTKMKVASSLISLEAMVKGIDKDIKGLQAQKETLQDVIKDLKLIAEGK